MKKTLALLTCLILSPLSLQYVSAETLGNIEYHLPQDGKGWKTRPLKDQSFAIWIPEDSVSKENKEVFAVSRVPSLANVKDKDGLKEGIERGMRLKYAEPAVTVTVLEETPNSMLYELTVTDAGQEKEHGWIRIFSTPEGNTMLTYHTELVDQVAEKRTLWLKTLQDAQVSEQASQ